MDGGLSAIWDTATIVKLAAGPFGLVLLVAGLACGIFRRPWYLAPFLAAIYTMCTIGYGLSGIGHGSSPEVRLLGYRQYLLAYTVIPVLAYGLGRGIGLIVNPHQASMRGSGQIGLVTGLTVAAVIAAAYGMAYWLARP
jgi:hypothetical protein